VGALLLQPSMVLIFYIMMILASSGVVSISLTGLSMIPDAIEVDEFKTGQRREGIYVGVNWFTRKFSVALMLWIVGILLSWVGYVPDTVQTENAICGIRLIYAEGTALFLLISIVLAALMPMTRKGHEALKEAIRLKKAGEKWDEDSIKDLL
jgi:Na+/melibiose symporter-like transporter